MPDLNLPLVTLTPDDFSRVVGLFRQRFDRPANPLKGISPEKVTRSLVHSVEYLLADRIDQGNGRGGWGHSDKEYMRRLYGPEIAAHVNDSVMTTVVVVHALHDCLLRMGSSGIQVSGRAPEDLLDSILNELDVYLKGRWDDKKGHGGVLVPGHEGDLIVVPRYRHTAWLFHLWYLLPKYRERMQLTAINLLEEFAAVDWANEKVATAVAAYSALSILESIPLCESLGEGTPARVEYLRHVLEGQIESQFSRKIQGWTSGNTFDGGRQLYTLFVCAEMSCMYSRPKEMLTKRIDTALQATMKEPWHSSGDRGVALKPGAQDDISASSLAVSALIRKPRWTAEEKTFLFSVVDYLIESLADGRDVMRGTFSWALSYFVRDISRYMVPENK